VGLTRNRVAAAMSGEADDAHAVPTAGRAQCVQVAPVPRPELDGVEARGRDARDLLGRLEAGQDRIDADSSFHHILRSMIRMA
jgi:hypothetical protein